MLRDDRAFGLALVELDAALPLACDVRFCLPATFSPTSAEQRRRKAAFILAPRLVSLELGCSGGAPFRLEPLPESSRPAPNLDDSKRKENP